MRIAILLLTIIGALFLTDPSFLQHLPFKPNGSLLAMVSIVGFSVLGFIITTLAPDTYMDEEYKSEDLDESVRGIQNPHYGSIMIARAIHTLAFAIIFATALYVFVV